jgi:hypothetical protein
MSEIRQSSRLSSLSDGDFASPELSAAWSSEIERRLADFDRGEIKADTADVAVERMRQFLADHRKSKTPP